MRLERQAMRGKGVADDGNVRSRSSAGVLPTLSHIYGVNVRNSPSRLRRATLSAPRRRAAGLRLAPLLLPALLGALDRLERLLARVPAVDLDDLPLGRLVDREEVRDLVAQRLREVVELLDVAP